MQLLSSWERDTAPRQRAAKKLFFQEDAQIITRSHFERSLGMKRRDFLVAVSAALAF